MYKIAGYILHDHEDRAIGWSRNSYDADEAIRSNQGIKRKVRCYTYEGFPKQEDLSTEVPEEQPPSGTLTDPEVAKVALDATFADRPEYFVEKETDEKAE